MRSFTPRFSGVRLRRGECGPPVCRLCARSPQTPNSRGRRPQIEVLLGIEKDTRFRTPRACVRMYAGYRAEKCRCGQVPAADAAKCLWHRQDTPSSDHATNSAQTTPVLFLPEEM